MCMLLCICICCYSNLTDHDSNFRPSSLVWVSWFQQIFRGSTKIKTNEFVCSQRRTIIVFFFIGETEIYVSDEFTAGRFEGQLTLCVEQKGPVGLVLCTWRASVHASRWAVESGMATVDIAGGNRLWLPNITIFNHCSEYFSLWSLYYGSARFAGSTPNVHNGSITALYSRILFSNDNLVLLPSSLYSSLRPNQFVSFSFIYALSKLILSLDWFQYI